MPLTKQFSRLGMGLWLGLIGMLPLVAGAVPTIQHWTTANGARVYFVPAPQLPIVDARVVFDAGSARDANQAGLALLTNGLLGSGTADLSADVVAERLDDVGAQLDTGALRDMAWLALRSLSEARYLNPAVEVASRLLREPAFAPDALERDRKRLIAAVREQAQSPAAIAERTFYRALYGQHPYASPPAGTEASLTALTRSAVQDFYRRYYVAANAVVAITGNLDRAAAERLAEALVGGLPKGEPAPPLPPVVPLTKAEVIRVPHPSAQSHVYLGQVGMAWGDPDFYSLYLGNHVLGGSGLVSTLAQEIREQRGLSYSVSSGLSPMRQPGPFGVVLQTRTDQADTAMQVVQSVVKDFVSNGPTADALQAARQNITGGFVLRLDSNSRIVEYLAMIGFYGLPLDYLQTFPDKIEAVTLEQVRSAWQRRIQPDRLLTVIVGGGG